MRCNACGYDNSADVSDCGSCGQPLSQATRDGKAIASLILGILSVTILSILAGIPAIILGHMSRGEIRRSLGRLTGKGLAMAGLIMGYASFAILGVFVIAAFMFLYLVPMPRSGVNLENSVAQVGAETIAAREFERAYSTYMQSLAAGPVTPEVRKAFQFDRQILDQMILERVTIIEARKAGFDAPDAEVEQLIRANPAFLENGEFIGRESYGQTLARNNLTIEEFENSTRDMILGQKLRESVTKGATDAAQQEARFISFLQEARTRMQERGEITINEEVLGRITAGSP